MRRRPLLLGLLALLSSTLVAGAAMPAGAGGSKPPTVPDPIAVPVGQKVVLDVTGKGVQIYDCTPSAANPAVNAWTFREPAAVLSGRGGRPVGIDFVGPTFESFDGSAVGGARRRACSQTPRRSPGCCWRPTQTGATGALPGRLHPTDRDPRWARPGWRLRPGHRRHRRRAVPGPLRVLRRWTST